jgi:hypothetical protein
LFYVLISFISVTSYGQDLISFQEGNLYGFKNTDGKIIVQPKYDWVGCRFYNGFTLVQQDGKNGVMDNKGNVVIPLKYNSIDISNYATEEIISVSIDNKYGYIDKKGNVVIDIKYENTGNFKNGLLRVMENGKWGIIKSDRTILANCSYDEIKNYCNGYAIVRIGNGEKLYMEKYKTIKYGYVDSFQNEFLYDFPNYNVYKNEKYSVDKEFYNNHDLFKIDDKTKLNKQIVDSLFLTALIEFKIAPVISLDDYCRINKVCIGYGLSIQGDLFLQGAVFQTQEKIKYFKKNTIHKIISSETLRFMAWSWLSPIYKKAFQSTDPFIQKTYKSIAQYLKDYINNYQQQKVETYLKNDEKKFARYDMNGNLDPNRKLSAFIDRLIIMHRIISIDDAKKWINIIADEVLTW